MSKKRKLIFMVVLLLMSVNISTPEAQDPLVPGTATGQLTVDNQTFNIKHAYVKRTKDEKDKPAFLVLLTDRNFPEDLSRLDRLDLNKYAARYDLRGLVIGIDENHKLFFIDILRVTTITGTAQFKPSSTEPGVIEGRVYTNGQKQFFNNKFEFDISFSVKP
jgi:hypothetical protein